MDYRNIVAVLYVAVLTHFHICLSTDYFYGLRDPFGPYPRIPDKEKLKKELLFAEECKKHIFPPKQRFY